MGVVVCSATQNVTVQHGETDLLLPMQQGSFFINAKTANTCMLWLPYLHTIMSRLVQLYS